MAGETAEAGRVGAESAAAAAEAMGAAGVAMEACEKSAGKEEFGTVSTDIAGPQKQQCIDGVRNWQAAAATRRVRSQRNSWRVLGNLVATKQTFPIAGWHDGRDHLARLFLAATEISIGQALTHHDCFLKLTGISGESLDATHKDDIEVLDWEWEVTQTSTMHSGSGGGAGKAAVHDFSFDHYVDRSSPNLLKYQEALSVD